MRTAIYNVILLCEHELKKKNTSLKELMKSFDKESRVENTLNELMKIDSVKDYIDRYGLYDLVYDELNYISLNKIEKEIEEVRIQKVVLTEEEAKEDDFEKTLSLMAEQLLSQIEEKMNETSN